jgi:tagatose 1,6-diphosphate aldolase
MRPLTNSTKLPVRPSALIDGDLRLVLVRRQIGEIDDVALTYIFDMYLTECNLPVGRLDLRIGHHRFLTHYAGHIGFSVRAEFRGRHLAARSCRLVFGLAKHNGVDPLWITCNPDNLASRRSCELAGGQLIEIVEVPTNCSIYSPKDRLKCRYRFDLQHLADLPVYQPASSPPHH